jgi:hypothetical protein
MIYFHVDRHASVSEAKKKVFKKKFILNYIKNKKHNDDPQQRKIPHRQARLEPQEIVDHCVLMATHPVLIHHCHCCMNCFIHFATTLPVSRKKVSGLFDTHRG